MKGITFGDYHTWNDFGLVVNSREISAPKPKTHYVDIEGANGSLDFTEAFGDIKYDRRTLKYKVTSLVPRKEFWTKFTEIQNALHGRELRITDDEDPDYYYIGRVTIDKWSIDKVIGSFTITVDAEPFKYHLYETVRTVSFTAGSVLVFPNDRMSVNPLITVSVPVTFDFNGVTYTINNSTEDLLFLEGNNVLTIQQGEGSMTVSYLEGAL